MHYVPAGSAKLLMLVCKVKSENGYGFLRPGLKTGCVCGVGGGGGGGGRGMRLVFIL